MVARRFNAGIQSGIARQHNLKALRIGGLEDHLHVLVGAPPTISVSKIAQLLKGGSSKWIHETFSALNHRAQLWDKLIFVQIGKVKKMGIPVYGVHEPVIHERDSHESYYSTIESEAKA